MDLVGHSRHVVVVRHHFLRQRIVQRNGVDHSRLVRYAIIVTYLGV